jgi:hypothetical protein
MAGVASAVMEDESVLCADCVHEATAGGVPESAETIVHAWIEPGPGVRCGWCGDSECPGECGRAER